MKALMIAALGYIGVLSSAASAEISLLASAAIDAALGEALPRFEAASGHSVKTRWGIATALRKDIENEAAFDVTILVGDLDGLARDGRIVAGTQGALGRSGYGLAVRRGAAKPDIATPEAFKAALLAARSVGYVEGGGSGAYFLGLLDRLAIADAMKPKLRASTNGQEALARGEVEMIVTGIVPILAAPGIELAGPLPGDLQNYSVFHAGVGAGAKDRAAAMALADFLRSEAAAAVFRKHGIEPAR